MTTVTIATFAAVIVGLLLSLVIFKKTHEEGRKYAALAAILYVIAAFGLVDLFTSQDVLTSVIMVVFSIIPAVYFTIKVVQSKPALQWFIVPAALLVAGLAAIAWHLISGQQ